MHKYDNVVYGQCAGADFDYHCITEDREYCECAKTWELLDKASDLFPSAKKIWFDHRNDTVVIEFDNMTITMFDIHDDDVLSYIKTHVGG